MKPFQNFDLYKGVILASLLLLPAAGWWIKDTQEAIDVADRAVQAATRRGGYLEEIGKLARQLEIVENNLTGLTGQTDKPDDYLSGQIYRSAARGQLEPNQFKFNAPRTETISTGNKQRVTDEIIKVDWLQLGGKDFAFSREFLFAVLFNCESGARGASVEQLPSIWKLYSLAMDNEQLKRLAGQQLTPPPDTEDKWVVSKMEFARREPAR